MPRKTNHLETVAARHRSGYEIVSAFNEKTPKGEAAGYLTAVVYLAPATIAGPKSVCPHSTPACQEGCLFTAGRGKTSRVHDARVRRTRLYWDDRAAFMSRLAFELQRLQASADQEGMGLAIRLNGTSDIPWERQTMRLGMDVLTLFEAFPRARFYDYTRIPKHHRRVPANWHLTFSLADAPLQYAIDHLLAGRNVAAVVPEEDKDYAPDWFDLQGATVNVVDGDDDGLRFLDPTPCLVLLRPKGRLVAHPSGMVRPDLIRSLMMESKHGHPHEAARVRGNGPGAPAGNRPPRRRVGSR